MFKYSKIDKDLEQKFNLYKNKGEYILASDYIKYNEIKYREILFNKKGFLVEEVRGIAYIDECNNIVRDKTYRNYWLDYSIIMKYFFV